MYSVKARKFRSFQTGQTRKFQTRHNLRGLVQKHVKMCTENGGSNNLWFCFLEVGSSVSKRNVFSNFCEWRILKILTNTNKKQSEIITENLTKQKFRTWFFFEKIWTVTEFLDCKSNLLEEKTKIMKILQNYTFLKSFFHNFTTLKQKTRDNPEEHPTFCARFPICFIKPF